jgi:pimeloyl-ACP methyl ester carboxylesterase
MIATLALALAAALWLPASVADAGGAPNRPKPTVVLVHGAWADSSSWSEVVGRLQRDGYTVEVPPNPLRGLAGDAAYLAAYLQTIVGPDRPGRALVRGRGHLQCRQRERERQGARLRQRLHPRSGRDSCPARVRAARLGLAVADPTTVFRLVPFPGSTPGNFDAYIIPDVYVGAFADDLPRHTAAVLAATQRPVTLGALATPSGPPAWRAIRSWALIGTSDRVLPAAEQAAMAARARAHTVRVNASHLSMISRPKEVTDLIRDAARATR